MKNKTLVLAALTLLATPAFAGGFYSGVDLGRGKTEVKVDGSKASKSANSVGVFGGYRVSDHFATEIGYQNLGKAKFKEAGKETGSVKANAYQASALAILPVSPDLELFGRLGLARAQVKDTSAEVGSVLAKESKNVSVVGLGARYALSKNFGIRSEYRQYGKVNGLKLSSLTVGADVRF